MRRYLETFFRHPWLYLLPLVLTLAASVMLASRAQRRAMPYTAEATIAANLDPTQPQPFGERPPAERHAGLLGELMETDDFILSALQQPPLNLKLTSQPTDAAVAKEVRSGWQQMVVGQNTLKVAFSCSEAAFCTDVVTAILGTYRNTVEPPVWTGQPAANTFHFRIIAPPRVRNTQPGVMREAALLLLVGGVLGLALVLAPVVLATWLDTTVHSPDDVLTQIGLMTVAVVPPDSLMAGRLSPSRQRRRWRARGA